MTHIGREKHVQDAHPDRLNNQEKCRSIRAQASGQMHIIVPASQKNEFSTTTTGNPKCLYVLDAINSIPNNLDCKDEKSHF